MVLPKISLYHLISYLFLYLSLKVNETWPSTFSAAFVGVRRPQSPNSTGQDECQDKGPIIYRLLLYIYGCIDYLLMGYINVYHGYPNISKAEAKNHRCFSAPGAVDTSVFRITACGWECSSRNLTLGGVECPSKYGIKKRHDKTMRYCKTSWHSPKALHEGCDWYLWWI